jgi:hypothetical protein
MAKIIGEFEGPNLFEDSQISLSRYPNAIQNKLKKSESAYIRRHSRKLYAIRYLGGKCIHCGYNHPLALAFHHLNPLEKNNSISNMLRGNGKDNSKKAIKKELDVCELTCVNCHFEIHTLSNNKCKNELLRMIGGIGFCLYCGYESDNIGSLQFHHRDRLTKKFSISSTYSSSNRLSFNRPIKEILKELQKCDVVCSNCHAMVNSHIERFSRFYPEILKKSYKWIDLPPVKTRKNIYANKPNKRYDRKHKPDPNGNIFGEVDNRSPKDTMKEDYMLILDGLI